MNFPAYQKNAVEEAQKQFNNVQFLKSNKQTKKLAMVRQVIWTERAQKDRIVIFTYCNDYNKSVVYSIILNGVILNAHSWR